MTAQCPYHPFNLPTGLTCSGDGERPHSRVFVATSGADLSDEREDES